MTHKNIVRYYQAWVEGGVDGTIQEAGVIEEEDDEDDPNDNKVDAGDVLATEDGESDDDNDGTGGWWTSSPKERDLPLQMKQATEEAGSSSSSSSDSSSSWSDTDGVGAVDANSGASDSKGDFGNYKQTSSSLSDFLENENEHNFGVSCMWYRLFALNDISHQASIFNALILEPIALGIWSWKSNLRRPCQSD
jgi:hypothetical protein